jgi:hypothetical protein
MDLENVWVSPAVQTALRLLEKRELAKVTRLQAVLDGAEFTSELASQLNAARDQLQTDPTKIYFIIGHLISDDPIVCETTIAWVTELALLKTEDVRVYCRCELLSRREADNKLAELTFKLLMQAKMLAA